MADAAILKRGAMKVVAFVVVLAAGRYFLWPELPVQEWLQDHSDWKLKFAFVAWAVVSMGMAYDALAVLAKGVVAMPEKKSRR
jgi:hypothetical protein